MVKNRTLQGRLELAVGAGLGARSVKHRWLGVHTLALGAGRGQLQRRGQQTKGESAARSGATGTGAVVKQTPLVLC